MEFQTQPQYEDHLGLITNVLGWQAAQEGDGAEPFIHSVRTHNPEKGAFSTWLFHNLTLSKKSKRTRNDHPHPNQFIPIDTVEVDGVPQPQQIAEFRDDLNNLSDDAKAVVGCVFRSIEDNTSKRTKWPVPSAASAKQIRGQLKLHCRETLSWSWPRYWRAVHEIENLFK
jgi:hypothetical protein